jgi:hypothetical protein
MPHYAQGTTGWTKLKNYQALWDPKISLRNFNLLPIIRVYMNMMDIPEGQRNKFKMYHFLDFITPSTEALKARSISSRSV